VSEALSDEQRAEIERKRDLCDKVAVALADATESEALEVLAMTFARLCVVQENPDRAFLSTVDGALAVFRDLTNAKYRNADPAVS